MENEDISAIRDVPSLKDKVSPEEWQTRVDLAAVYRLVVAYGWNKNIYNHASARVPGEPDYFLMKAHALSWDEVTASNLVKVNMHEELDERAGVNRPGFVLHSSVLRARDEVMSCIHVHEDASVAVSVMKDGLLPLSQDAVFLFEQIGYHDYQGITENAEERDEIVANLGDRPVLMLRSHGSVTAGRTVSEAFKLTQHLIKGCQIQLDLMASGAELIIPSPEICRNAVIRNEAHNQGRGMADWPAYLREMDEIDPSYQN